MDLIGKRYLEADVFKQTLLENGLELFQPEMDQILARYDPGHKNVIYYDFFCDEVYGNEDSGSKGLPAIMDEIYKAIRTNFVTFDAFLKRYDGGKPKRGSLTKEEFATFMNHFNINVSTPVMAGLMEALKLKNK
jgi:Ca2+-binding EF-hand superfamily protein